MFQDKDNIDDIKIKLSRLDIDKDAEKAKKMLRQIVRASSCGVDTMSVFPTVAKLLASNDLTVKKLASWYISQHGDHPDFTLLVINTLLKDCLDSNPMIRGLALKTLCNIPLDSVAEYSIQPVTKALHDSSAYVRRVAVMACGKIHSLNPDLILASGWIDTLYGMIRDNDPVVVSNCITVLDLILSKEGGIVVNKNMAHHLLNKLQIFSDWHLSLVIDILKKYTPRTDDETLDIMNIADPHLKSNNMEVVIVTLNYFLFLIRHMPHLRSELYSRAKLQIYHFLGSGNPELVFSIMNIVEKELPKEANMSDHYKVFFCKYNDPVYLKEKKITLLPTLANETNVQEILEELNMYSMDVCSKVAQSAVRAIADITQIHSQFSEVCLEQLLLLLEHHPQDVLDQVLLVLQDLDMRKYPDVTHALTSVKRAIDFIETEEGKAAVITILGDYGEHLEDSPYLLENFINGLEEESSLCIRRVLLSATTKLFLKRPAECQDMLSKLFEICMECMDVELRDCVLFHIQLLRTDVNETNYIIMRE